MYYDKQAIIMLSIIMSFSPVVSPVAATATCSVDRSSTHCSVDVSTSSAACCSSNNPAILAAMYSRALPPASPTRTDVFIYTHKMTPAAHAYVSLPADTDANCVRCFWWRPNRASHVLIDALHCIGIFHIDLNVNIVMYVLYVVDCIVRCVHIFFI